MNCSFWADNFDGIPIPLKANDIAFVAMLPRTAIHTTLEQVRIIAMNRASYHGCANDTTGCDDTNAHRTSGSASWMSS
jgi:hypothetical protein